MKTRLILATLLLLAFGTARAQDTVTAAPKQADPAMIWNMPDMSQLPELLRELGVNLQHLTDSVDWKSFEEDMEKWGAEMEEWGRKMERWGERFEGPNRDYELEYRRNGQPMVKAIQIDGSGDVHICQNRDIFSIESEDPDNSHYRMEGDKLFLSGSEDFTVTLQHLDELALHSSGDVTSKGTLKGRNLFIEVTGSGDVCLYVDYDTICVNMKGSGDVVLNGQCNVLFADVMGSGDLMVRQLMVRDSRINATGSGIAITPGSGIADNLKHREKVQRHNSLLMDSHWNGFEAGLNMLIDPTWTYVYNNPNGDTGLEIRPLRSWYFGFNIADVGIAFDRRHTVGLFTGVGLGWNNFSWNNDVRIGYDSETDGYTVVPIESDLEVKNSKYGALFLQVPLMFEVRPTRHMYIDAGVTGGLRIAQWNRIKYENGNSDKQFHGGIGSGVRLLKLDASLRVGAEDLGFFANYALLPLFVTSNAKVHPVSFGFSINF